MEKNTFIHIMESEIPLRRQTSAPASSSSHLSEESSASADHPTPDSSNHELQVSGERGAQEDPVDDSEDEAEQGTPADSAQDQESPSRRDKRRKRPNKGRRERFKNFCAKLETQAQADPENFDFGSLSMPSSVAADPKMVAGLKERFEEVAREAAAKKEAGGAAGGPSGGPAQTQLPSGWNMFGGASSSNSAARADSGRGSTAPERGRGRGGSSAPEGVRGRGGGAAEGGSASSTSGYGRGRGSSRGRVKMSL